MFFISQTGKQDCAFTCLEMLLANLNKDKNYLYLRHEDRVYNFKEIIRIAKNYNLNLIGVRIYDYNELINCKQYPFVAIIKNSEGRSHSVLILKVTKKKVIYFDPSCGKMVVPFHLFISKWTRLALIIKDFVKTKCNIIPPEFIDTKDKAILPIFCLLSGLFILFGTYFLDKSIWFYLPIVFFTLFIIFEILFRSFLIRSMNHLDDKIYSLQMNREASTYKEIFETIQHYKYSAFTLLPNLISSILIVIFITILMILNSFWNVLYIVICVLFAIGTHFIFNPYYKVKEDEILECESKTYLAEDEYDFAHFGKKAGSKASQLGLTKTLYKYVQLALLLIMSIVIMYITDTASLTYLVFYLCINVYLLNTLERTFDYAVEKDNFNSLKAKLINYLK